MKIRILSDLHHEFYRQGRWRDQPWMTNSGEDVLVLAGDIASGSTNAVETLKHFKDMWIPKIVYVPGNHEYYGTSMPDFDEKMQIKVKQLDGVYYMNPGMLVIDGVLFIGTPLYTNFYGDPLAEHQAQTMISDFRLVRDLKTEHYISRYGEAVNYIRQAFNVVDMFTIRHVVVVTHWLPSRELIAPEYRSDKSGLNSYFANSLDHIMQDINERFPDTGKTWIYGHTHHSGDRALHGWRCIANPSGYPNEYHQGFNPILTIDV
jgi:UDP-2,3-diacylglucosamine pyrophosphatase LpxH